MKPIRPNISKGGSYPPEFREEAVQYWLSSGHTLAHVAADLGLSPEYLRSWRKQIEAVNLQAGSNGQGQSTDQLTQFREIGQLRRELEAMTRQRDMLDIVFFLIRQGAHTPVAFSCLR
jgi:transposase-like protein